MERVRYADQVPLVYEVASIPEKFIKDFKKEEITSHFFQTLQKHGYRIGKSQQTIYARLAKEKIAHYWKLKRTCYSWSDSDFLPRRWYCI